MILLDLVRHGPAVRSSEAGDPARALTPEGRSVVRSLARRLSSEGWRPSAAYSSPYLRARETAEILASAAGGLEILTLAELRPAEDPGTLVQVLAARIVPGAHVLLVSHQPLMGDFVKLLSGEEHGFNPGCLLRLAAPGPLAPGACRPVASLDPWTFS